MVDQSCCSEPPYIMVDQHCSSDTPPTKGSSKLLFRNHPYEMVDQNCSPDTSSTKWLIKTAVPTYSLQNGYQRCCSDTSPTKWLITTAVLTHPLPPKQHGLLASCGRYFPHFPFTISTTTVVASAISADRESIQEPNLSEKA